MEIIGIPLHEYPIKVALDRIEAGWDANAWENIRQDTKHPERPPDGP